MKRWMVIVALLILCGCTSTVSDDAFEQMELKEKIVVVFSESGIDIKGLSVDDGVVTIAKDAYIGSGDYIRYSINDDVIKMGQILITSNEIDEVNLYWYAEIVDRYGNATDEAIAYMQFEFDTMSKINFDNVAHDNIPGLADKYWEHAIFKELGI